MDGSSTKKNGGAGVVLITPDEEELCSSLRMNLKANNNEAEYEVVLAGLGLAWKMGVEFVEVQRDSQVIVKHIQGEFEARGGSK
jgi:ribonuclease HI